MCFIGNGPSAILSGEALKAGAFPHLQKLGIGGQRACRGVWEGMDAGGCPKLRELELLFARFDNKPHRVALEGTCWGDTW